ncbi:hypothetical protein [Paucibacter sp. B51]|uniref:hypothetical protein n=1 Tax=Paucibacter sp. B51 TaxID=2993315 RepID=UPI0022EBBB87|nr:hypothetical protein [Paucibacter sp. B51]
MNLNVTSRMPLRQLLITGACITLSGCQTLGLSWRENKGFDLSGAYQITDRDVVEPVDLAFLLMRYAPGAMAGRDDCEALSQHTPRWGTPGVAHDPKGGDEGEAIQKDQTRLDRSVQYFACRAAQSDEASRRLARNALQERLLVSSTQRCTAFKIGLQRDFSRTNFGLGLLTTVAATAGALVNSPAAAQNWAGTAAISSGTRAEYNQAFFANLAAHVVIEGVDKRRRDVYDQIQKEGQTKAYSHYPVEAAIKDALYFHGQCSVVAGLEQAANAIRSYDDPGFGTAVNMIARVKLANQMMNGTNVSSETLLKQSAALSSATPLLAGSRLAVNSDNGQPTRPLTELQESLEVITKTVTALRTAQTTMLGMLPAGHTAGQLGLTRDFAGHGIDDELAKTCRERTARFEIEALEKRTLASIKTDASEQSKLSAEADQADRQAMDVATASRAASQSFLQRVNTAIASWHILFSQAVKDKQPAAAEGLKRGLENAPRFANEPGVKTLKQLCAA